MNIVQWQCGNDTLLQEVYFDPYGNELDTNLVMGKDATYELKMLIADPDFCKDDLIFDDRGIFGYYEKDGSRVEFFDCEGITWKQYLLEQAC